MAGDHFGTKIETENDPINWYKISDSNHSLLFIFGWTGVIF